MAENSAIELREYLRRRNPPPCEQFDDFLGRVEVLFRLRVRAEERFMQQPHTAKGRKGPLPLGWDEIAALVRTDEASPPENLVTHFARECVGVVEEIKDALRKVLVRSRERISLGLVQQVDAQCLRWLTRQPGRDGVEKAGACQRILAVVRRENYNTLENRVFKDFVARAGQEASIYLRKYEKRFPDHDVIQRVRRLRAICDDRTRAPLLESVGEIRELPVPNYVLREDRRYSKIWKAYVDLIHQASVAERLWHRRSEVAAILHKLRIEAPRQVDPRARFHAPIWFSPLDGRHELLDAPFFANELADRATYKCTTCQNDDVVLDLTGGSLRYDLLIYGRHRNAKPYLQDYAKPSIEDREMGTAFHVSELLEKRDAVRLRDYMEQLHAKVGGRRWFVLVPDDWDSLWQEAVIKAVPLARSQVFLIWRSVAAAIGALPRLRDVEDGGAIVVLDVSQSCSVGMSRLTLTRSESGELVPQRRAFKENQRNSRYGRVALRRMGRQQAESAFLEGRCDRLVWPEEPFCHTFIGEAKHVILVSEGYVAVPEAIQRVCCVSGNHLLLAEGVARFAECLEAGQIPYYDELEALSLIVQSEENVVPKVLVEANEKWPGGRVMECPLLERAATVARGEDHVRLLLCMGEVTRTAALRVKRHDFGGALEDDQELDLAVRMVPGQGMAVVAVQARFLRDPIELDFLSGMSTTDERGRRPTIASLEDTMLRSFPPDAPHVIADVGLWGQVRRAVVAWVENPNHAPDGGWFAKATDLYPVGAALPEGLTPIERLRRKNVFGNAPDHRFPVNEDFSPLFRKLAERYDKVRPTSDVTSEYGEIVRAIAWTYQSDNVVFNHVRRQTVNRIATYASRAASSRPLPQEYTLCANLCDKAAEWNVLWTAVVRRLSDQSEDSNVDEELRLLYNLLQFHPTFLYDTDLYQGSACWEMMTLLMSWYNRYNEPGPSGSRRIGYVLKCILYLLRCRKYDGKVFATAERDRDKHSHVQRCLKSVPKAASKRGLHRVALKYLEGKGTIAGLPTC